MPGSVLFTLAVSTLLGRRRSIFVAGEYFRSAWLCWDHSLRIEVYLGPYQYFKSNTMCLSSQILCVNYQVEYSVNYEVKYYVLIIKLNIVLIIKSNIMC